MRILVGDFTHEGNSFAETPTTLRSFEEREWCRGDEMLTYHRGRGTVVGGFLTVIDEHADTAIPSISANALPSGPITAQTFRFILDQLVAAAQAQGDGLDGVLLGLHGGMVVEEAAGIPDPEGTIAAAVRRAIGDAVPMVVVLDPHSDTSDLLLEAAQVSLCYNEEPHRDAYDRGIEAARILRQIVLGEIRPVSVRERPPMLITGTHTTTDQAPMKVISDLRAVLEAKPGVIDISVHFGFFGCDQPDSGFSVVCTTDGDEALARRFAREVAEAAWAMRQDFVPVMVTPDLAVAEALRSGEPVGLVDECDDPAGGGSAESVTLVRAMIEGGVSRGAVSSVLDPEVARALEKAGVGAEMTVTVGAKTDRKAGAPITLTGRVAKISREPLPLDDWSGRTYDAGIIAVLDVGGVLVAITERKLVSENIDLFAHLGWDVSSFQVVGFKGLGGHIRQVIGPKMRRYVRINGVGATHRDLRQVGPYRHISRPIWPLDDLPLSAYPGIT